MNKGWKEEQIESLFKSTKYLDYYFDYLYYMDKAIDEQSIQVFEEGIKDIFSQDYFTSFEESMEFLMEEDPSLEEIFEYLQGSNFSFKELNSHKLAEILLQKKILDEWDAIKEDIIEILEEDEE
jgi:hypothetical protein